MSTVVAGPACVTVTQTTPPHRPVMGRPSVAELRRAWDAATSGSHTEPAQASPMSPWPPLEPPAHDAWSPGEELVVVAGAHPQAGASTLALAMAEADPPSRVVECSLPATSSLAAAGCAELGVLCSWSRAQRQGVVLERPADGAAGVPLTPDRLVRRSIVDVGLLGDLAGLPWVAPTVAEAASVVVVAAATVPGVRRLEVAVEEFGPARCVAVLRMTARGRLPGRVRAAVGPCSESLMRSGRWVLLPRDGRLLVEGVTPQALPKPVVSCGHAVLGLLHDLREGGR